MDSLQDKIKHYDSLFDYKKPEPETKQPETGVSFVPDNISNEKLGLTLRAFSAISQNLDLILKEESVKFLQSLKLEIFSFESVCRGNSGLDIVQKKQRLDIMKNIEMFYRRFTFSDNLQTLQASISGLESAINFDRKYLEDKLNTLTISTSNAKREVEALSLQHRLDGSVDAVKGGLDRILKTYENFDHGKFLHLMVPAKTAMQSVLKAIEGTDEGMQEKLSTLYVELNSVMGTLYLDAQFRLARRESSLYSLAKEQNADVSALSTAQIYVGQDFRAVFEMIAKNHRQKAVLSINEDSSAYAMYAYVKGGNCPKDPFSTRVIEGVLKQYGGSLRIHSGESFVNYEIILPKKPCSVFPQNIKNYAILGAQAENMPKQ